MITETQNNNVLNFICKTFKKSKKINIKNFKIIKFPSTKTYTDELHPDTKSKFINFYSIHLTKGIYGPIYRYCPDMKNLYADNERGGYFTNLKLECEGCIKRKLWLYNKNRKYFYFLSRFALHLMQCCIPKTKVPSQLCLPGRQADFLGRVSSDL